MLIVFVILASLCLASSKPLEKTNNNGESSLDIKSGYVLQGLLDGPKYEEGDSEGANESKQDEEDVNNDEEKNERLKGPKTEEEEDEEEAAELNPDLFEGDLKLSKKEIDKLNENTVSKKDTVAAIERQWPRGRVPILIDSTFDDARKKVLIQAIDDFNTKTCVRFVPKQATDVDYIKFIVGQGCYSTSVGKSLAGGEQQISIGDGCNFPGTVIHEMMHAIGFFHEHTRLDRNQYITINWQNIERGRESQFKKYAHGEGDYLGEPYDYDSVMQYPRDGFGILMNNKRLSTIVPKDKPWRKIGQRDGFSKIDINQINKLYKCAGKAAE